MIIFRTTFYRIMKHKVRLLIIILMPLLFIVTFLSMGTEIPLKVAVVDEDNTPFTAMLMTGITENFTLVDCAKDDIINELIAGNIDYALLIEPGFTGELIAGKTPLLDGYSIGESNLNIPIENYLSYLLSAAEEIANSAENDTQLFYQGLGYLSSGIMELSLVRTDSVDRSLGPAAIGFLMQFSLYMSVITTAIIVEDKMKKTFFRIFAAPISVKRYMSENLLSFFIVGIIQVIAVLLFTRYYMNIYLGESIWNMLLLLTIFTAVSITFGLLITAYAKNTTQAYLTIAVITTPMIMIGGGYWPRHSMPEILIKIGDFIPTSWVMSATDKLLYGGNIASIGKELVILLAFAVVFFLAGVIRKVDISR